MKYGHCYDSVFSNDHYENFIHEKKAPIQNVSNLRKEWLMLRGVS